jgi:hypothetical protein
MAALYRWMVFLAFFILFPVDTLAAFIVDDLYISAMHLDIRLICVTCSTKPALACEPFLIQWQGGKGEISKPSFCVQELTVNESSALDIGMH